MTEENDKIIPKSSEMADQDQLEKPESKPETNPESKTDDPIERGGPKGPEPTRFGDWESNGRCTDF